MNYKLFNTLNENHITLETIEYQKDDYANDLYKEFNSIVENISTDVYESHGDISRSNEFKAIEKITQKRLGLNIKLKSIKSATPIAMSSPVSLNNPMVVKWARSLRRSTDEIEDILKYAKEKKGTIDLKRAKITGMYSSIESTIALDVIHLNKNWHLNARQICAIYLHEVGHIFTIFEKSINLNSTNQILADLAKSRLDGKELKLDYVYKELTRDNHKVNKQDVENLMTKGSLVPGERLSRSINAIIESQLDSSSYDETSWESQADMFVSRFGYGRYLVEALSIVRKFDDYNKMVRVRKIARMVAFVSAIIIFSLTIGFIFIGTALDIIASTLYSLALAVMFKTVHTNEGASRVTMTYDTDFDRYNRLRQDYINELKNLSLSDKDISITVDNIKLIDQVMLTVKSPEDVIQKVINFIVPSNKRVKEQIERQQKIESMANNDLFLQSAKFKVMKS